MVHGHPEMVEVDDGPNVPPPLSGAGAWEPDWVGPCELCVRGVVLEPLDGVGVGVAAGVGALGGGGRRSTGNAGTSRPYSRNWCAAARASRLAEDARLTALE
jgi:hypothetical protein